MVEIIFILSLLLVLYVYIGYPLIAACLGALLYRRVRKEPLEATVTIIIAAYNEEESIAATIENKLCVDYPQDKLEIIVISDGSTDRTDAIVNSFAAHNVRLLRQTPRAGKTSALNMAVPLAHGEIIVFSDANSLYAPDALRHLLENFADGDVGYVTGKMIYANPDGTPIGEGCSAYMRYENALRLIETRLGSVVGVDGGVDAVRKVLFRPMNPDQLPDLSNRASGLCTSPKRFCGKHPLKLLMTSTGCVSGCRCALSGLCLTCVNFSIRPPTPSSPGNSGRTRYCATFVLCS
jgi:cellulose synthase/poly-beta-1,6-N-acetylglucosamine synthase-like glycosyltransferase